MTVRPGSRLGAFRRATIRGFNPDGTIRIGLDEGSSPVSLKEVTAPAPVLWAGRNGEFMGGYPSTGSSVIVSQGQGGEWFVVSYIPSDNVFDTSFVSTESTKMSYLKPGRALIQTKNEHRVFVDPNIGIQIGDAKNFIHINPQTDIISHNFDEEISFTESGRQLNQKIKRDLSANLSRNVIGSTLDSQTYDNSLFTVGMDPSTSTSSRTTTTFTRNLPLVEQRELVYEFANSYNFTKDEDESAKYVDKSSGASPPKVSRREMRSDVFSLSLEHPNHLIETIKGTAVDAAGNILDINRNILPIGKTDDLSLRKSSNKQDTFNKIRAQHRKAIAFHFEINARKGGIDPVGEPSPDVSNTDNYSRPRSRFFIDIDKEGQFKINIPSSSEIGNIPLLTRYENFSVLDAKKNGGTNPNEFSRSSEKKDIFIENFAGKANINLNTSAGELDSLASPVDYQTDESIKYGTAFHDIKETCSTFQSSSGLFSGGRKLVSYDPGNRLNSSPLLSKIVSDPIITSGPNANAGGRSGLINLDGFVSLNIGANTIDRQSMWIDCAGGIVSRIGRDRNGISHAASLDGDLLIQIGGEGIGNEFDDRFSNENDSNRPSKIEIHVISTNGVAVFAIDQKGIEIASPGRISLSCQQDMILKSNSRLLLEAPIITTHASSSQRNLLKFPPTTI